MTPAESFATDVRGDLGTPLRLEFFARYRKSAVHNGTDVLIQLRHRTTGHGPCIALTRDQVSQFAGCLQAEVSGRWDTVQDSLEVTHPAGRIESILKVGHRASRVANYATDWRRIVLRPDVRESAIEWLEKWLQEGWS